MKCHKLILNFYHLKELVLVTKDVLMVNKAYC